MTTYVKCKNCGEEFKSPIQVQNLKTNIISGNITNCPTCGKQTIMENSNMFNK